MLRRASYLIALSALLGISAAANAASVTNVTSLTGSHDGANRTLDYVLGASYGYGTVLGTGSLSSSISWTNGFNSITFERVYDAGGSGSPLLLNGGNYSTADDNVWQDGHPIFQVQVRYAGYGQTLGWYNNNTNTAQDILSITGSGLNPTFTYAPGGPPTALSSSFLWYDKTTGGGTLYSDPTRNGDGGDHMITYRVTGSDASGALINGGLPAYVICFEDLPLVSGDRDYNDMVVQVSQLLPSNIPVVPVPAAAWSGLVTLAGAAAWRGFRKRK